MAKRKNSGFARTSTANPVTNVPAYQVKTEGEQIIREALAEGMQPKTAPAPQGKQSTSAQETQAEESTVPLSTLESLVKQAAQNAAEAAIATLTESHNKEKQELETQVSEANQKAAEAEATAKDAVELAKVEAQKQIAEAKQESDAAIAEAKQEAEQAKKDKETLEGVMKLTGSKLPNTEGNSASVNTLTNPLKDQPVGIIKEIQSLYEGTPVHSVRNGQNQLTCDQRDLKNVRDRIVHHLREARFQNKPWQNSQIVKDLEESMKNHGFLNGGRVTNAAGPTIGTPGSVGAFFLDVLSSMMRETHNQHNIWWQFTMTAFNAATAPSLTMGVPRWNFLPQPQDIADFELATSATFEAVQGAIGTATDSQSLEATTVPITVTEYGLGKPGVAAARPVFIPEFHEAISLISLMSALDSRLMQHYYAFEELLIRLQYEATTVTAYNNNADVVFAPGDVTGTGGGTMTEAFANSVYTEMYANQIPSFPDGCYALVLNPYAANQYKSSLGDQYRPVTEEQKMAVSNTFSIASGVEIGRVNGYIGKYNNFHVFEGNSFGVGAAGSVSTVVSETIGGAARDAVDSFAFGPGCVGRGIALGAEIRASGVNPFNRGESFIWLSREGVAPMDLDVALDPNQQTRCYKLRTTKQEVA